MKKMVNEQINDQMVNDQMVNGLVARKSSFFGLFHHLVYTPTNSRISDYSR